MLSGDITWQRFLSRTESATPAVRGKQELRAVWESQVEAVDLRREPEEFTPVGDEKVVVTMRLVARGRGSDIPLTTAVTWVYTLDEVGACVKVETFATRDEALKAARAPK
jgi:hypothetical protein